MAQNTTTKGQKCQNSPKTRPKRYRWRPQQLPQGNQHRHPERRPSRQLHLLQFRPKMSRKSAELQHLYVENAPVPARSHTTHRWQPQSALCSLRLRGFRLRLRLLRGKMGLKWPKTQQQKGRNVKIAPKRDQIGTGGGHSSCRRGISIATRSSALCSTRDSCICCIPTENESKNPQNCSICMLKNAPVPAAAPLARLQPERPRLQPPEASAGAPDRAAALRH